MNIEIHPASLAELVMVSEVLCEAASWLEQRGIPLWTQQDTQPDTIRPDVAGGAYILALIDGTPAGTLKYQLEDPMFWPDALPGEGSYIHRVSVRRAYSNGQLSAALLNWAAQRARADLRQYLRLDCVADRLSLRAVYERFGFTYHSERHVGPYHVARYQLELYPN